MGKLRYPCTPRPYFLSQEAKTYWIVHAIYTLFPLTPISHCLVTFCLSIYLSLPSLSHFSFTHFFTHKKTYLSSFSTTDTVRRCCCSFAWLMKYLNNVSVLLLIACQCPIQKNCSVRLGSKAAFRLGSVMFYNTQQRLGTDGLSMRMLSVSMPVAT